MSELPAYLRIAADLRARMASGELRAADRLPSLSRLMARYAVSSTIVRNALAILAREGLIEGRSGSGVYVRDARRLVRRSPSRPPHPQASGKPDKGKPGKGNTDKGKTDKGQPDPAEPGWESDTVEEGATADVAARLAIEPGDPVRRTRSRYLADGRPLQLATSWEPLAKGTPVDAIEERVTWRAADETEIAGLGLPLRGGYVLAIRRTSFAAGVPVETADIVLDAGRYELHYRIPLD